MGFIFVIAVLIMSVVVHEVSHGYAALALGDKTAKYEGRLTLNPISHLDLVGSLLVPLMGYFLGGFIIGWAKPVPFNPYNLRSARWGEALVAAAGPLSNFLIAFVFGWLIKFATQNHLFNEAFFYIASFVVLINITLAVFNLMPIPPLDGSKIVFALLPLKFQHLRFVFERFGLFLVLFFAFFLWQFISPLIFKIFTLFVGDVAFKLNLY